MRNVTLSLISAAILLVSAAVSEAAPPASIKRFPSVSSVPSYGPGVGSYGYGSTYRGYGASPYVSPYGYGSYTSPFGYGGYGNSGLTTPYGYGFNYYRNPGYPLTPGLGTGYGTGVITTPYGTRTYGFGY